MDEEHQMIGNWNKNETAIAGLDMLADRVSREENWD
jgi:hypothetical protein